VDDGTTSLEPITIDGVDMLDSCEWVQVRSELSMMLFCGGVQLIICRCWYWLVLVFDLF